MTGCKVIVNCIVRHNLSMDYFKGNYLSNSCLKIAYLQTCCFSVTCFGVRVSVTFHFMCVYIIFSSVWVAEWPPFGK